MAGFLSSLGGGYNFQPGQMMVGGQTFGPQVLNPIAPMAPLQDLSPITPTINPAAAPGGWLGIEGLGKNLGTLKMGVGALGGLASLWQAGQQNKMARKSFEYNKGLMDTNLANSIKAYNLSIDDKFRSRAAFEGTSAADRDASISKWSARDERKG